MIGWQTLKGLIVKDAPKFVYGSKGMRGKRCMISYNRTKRTIEIRECENEGIWILVYSANDSNDIIIFIDWYWRQYAILKLGYFKLSSHGVGHNSVTMERIGNTYRTSTGYILPTENIFREGEEEDLVNAILTEFYW